MDINILDKINIRKELMSDDERYFIKCLILPSCSISRLTVYMCNVAVVLVGAVKFSSLLPEGI
jgi:hypothetical protein